MGVKKSAADKAGKPQPFPIVAIGASAGGLEAITKLLEHLPSDLGMAYVVIQHLSPDHESILPEILEKKTKMKVMQVSDGMKVAQDTVFVIPPKAYMSIIDGELKLGPRNRSDGNHSIDFFLSALAPIYQHKAIAIILSGTASDGTAGVQAIKAEGGITFAQDHSAKFQGMPDNAVDSGFIDLVLPPEKIARELTTFGKIVFSSRLSYENLVSKEGELRKIHAMLHNKYQVDFSSYKQTTIARRILRRMGLNKLNKPEDYIQLLREKPGEIDLLYKDLLINVTSFFREPDLYQSFIKKILPLLFKNRKASEPLRIWIPACSSGEEACSIAICLFEYLGEKAIVTPIQIFATDLSEGSIEKARAGIYSKSTLQNVSAQRLRRFFIKTGSNYQIIKPIRDICIYATHNLLKDPPFSRIDLISCQNVLIYLEAGSQKKILRSFHYALKPTGYLLLGKSEAIGNTADLFSQVNKDLKLFSKKAVNSNFNFDLRLRPFTLPDSATDVERMLAEQDGEEDVEKETNKLLLSAYVPPGVTVNKELQIIHFHGDLAPYLQPSSGKASLHLLKLVRDDLVFEVRSLINQVKKEGQAVRRENMEVIPLKNNSKHPYYLILFKTTSPTRMSGEQEEQKSAEKNKEAGSRQSKRLTQELKDARDQMKSISEEFEAVREELQSANEELLSSNEELQSINEELETSKEELQSANEELTTINEELQNRNTDLKEALDFNAAIIETIRQPLLVLSSDMRISIANKAFYSIFNLKPDETEGNYFYEIGKGLWNRPALKRQLNDIISKSKSFENFELSLPISASDNKILLFSAMRMNVENDKKNKFLLAIEDITENRRSEELIRNSNLRYETFIARSTEGICRFEFEKPIPIRSSPEKQLELIYKYAKVTECNDAMAAIHGHSVSSELLGAGLEDFIP